MTVWIQKRIVSLEHNVASGRWQGSEKGYRENRNPVFFKDLPAYAGMTRSSMDSEFTDQRKRRLHSLIKKSNKIFLDRDRDGFIDSVDLLIHIFPSSGDPEVLCAVMDLSASIGFETMGINFPLVTTEGIDSSSHHHLYIGLDHELKTIPETDGSFFLKGNNKTSLAQSIRKFALSIISKNEMVYEKRPGKRFRERGEIDLLRFFSVGGLFFHDLQKPWLILFPYRILLFSHFGLRTAVEAANFSSRLGLETVQLSLPFGFKFPSKSKKCPFIYIGKKEDLHKLGIKGLDYLHSFHWEGGLFTIPSRKGFFEILISGTEKGLQRILRYLTTVPTDSKEIDDPIFKGIKGFIKDMEDSIKSLFCPSSLSQKMVKEYLLDDERKEILKILKERLQKVDSPIGSIEILAGILRTKKERRGFELEIKKLLKTLGWSSKNIRVTVLNAYKPGLSWMREVVLKEVSKIGVDRVEITLKPFKENGLEEADRWLQEIYPVDEIFSRRLGIPKEKIGFKKDSRIKEVYRVCGWQKGVKIYENQFSPEWETRDYLFLFPQLGKVHPWTGWMSVKIDGQEVFSRKVNTWMEQVWEIYQKQILPLLRKEIDDLCSTNRLSFNTLFEEIRFDLFLNYPGETLGVDEERISPLEALHEEFYFVTLDFFSTYLKKKGISKKAPGRILPVVHPNERGVKEKFRFTLTHHPDGFFKEEKRPKIFLEGIAFRGADLLVNLCIGTDGMKNLDNLEKFFKNFDHRVFQIEKISYQDKPKKGLRIIAVAPNLIKKRSPQAKKKSFIKIPMDRPIGYKEFKKIIHSFDGWPGVKIVEEGDSSGGLPIYSLEHIYPSQSVFTSYKKSAIFRPTFFINCRHHANEVSSTNAGLKLSFLLATNPQFRRLLKGTNVVINPMENVDGVVTLEQMLKWTPKDKLHAARYNWAGQEYYLEYFNPKTPFKEARVKPGIWQRWLPDICVDNHGFPSHEWEQPFSGYTPFRFREWWIPKGFFFFYLPFLEEKEGSIKRRRTETFGRWIWSFLLKEKRIMERNQTFWERYWRYREPWISRSKKMDKGIFFFPLQKRFRLTNYSYRYPSITTIEFITEVADEITYGGFLRDCIKAHLETNLSVIRLLNSCHFPVKKYCYKKKEEKEFFWCRERPLTFEN